MSADVKCPKCGSTQVSAQKRGFSGGKAAAGVILTGGVGGLAGLHGADKIEVHCMKCGHHWNPVEQAKQETYQRQQAADTYKKAWKTAFYTAYEAGDLEAAESILRLQRGAMLQEIGMDAIYKKLKGEDRAGLVINLIIGAIFLLILLKVVSCVS